MAINEGFPPGYEIRRSDTQGQEAKKRIEKQQKALNDLQNSVNRNMIQGEPIPYDADGIPAIVDAPKEGPSLEEETQAALNGPPKREGPQGQQPQQPQQPQARPTPKSGSAFFGGEQAAPSQQSKNYAPPEIVSRDFQHPVVAKMLRKFGLKKAARYNLDIYTLDSDEKLTYTMTIVPEEVQTWALGESRNMVTLEGEQSAVVYFQLLFISCSVLAIDGEPCWRVFNVQPLPHEAEDLANDPLDMSIRMRKVCAKQLAHIFWAETEPIGDKLIEFYESQIASRKIISSMDKENESLERYVCPLDGCDVYDHFKPEIDPETGLDRMYFCKVHGTELVKTVDLARSRDTPLG